MEDEEGLMSIHNTATTSSSSPLANDRVKQNEEDKEEDKSNKEREMNQK